MTDTEKIQFEAFTSLAVQNDKVSRAFGLIAQLWYDITCLIPNASWYGSKVGWGRARSLYIRKYSAMTDLLQDLKGKGTISETVLELLNDELLEINKAWLMVDQRVIRYYESLEEKKAVRSFTMDGEQCTVKITL